MEFDPEEIVNVPGLGKVRLVTAVRHYVAQPGGVPPLATIFRDGSPALLHRPRIEELAQSLEFRD